MKNGIKDILLNALFGFIICVVIGDLLYGNATFNIKDPQSALFFIGLYGAIFFSVMKYSSSRNTVLIGALIAAVNEILMGRALTITLIIRDVLFFASLFGALILYNFIIKKFPNLIKFVRSLALSLFLGILNIISTLMLALIINPSLVRVSDAVIINARIAALVGLGLGIGFDLYETFRSRIFHPKVKNAV